ncbi:PIN domain-containing protein [Candidatus Woesearchaeota archaeon]|nr:PIN domain-containing protein [Candidatus Woesearchaeota archaeon]
MKCLDTYALVEISRGNPSFSKYEAEAFLITDVILAEFYGIVLREHDERTADYWFRRLAAYSKPMSKELLVESVKYRCKHRAKRLSFFDCAGYIFARSQRIPFVTGDKEFRDVEGVEFVK